jgi:hypothetical protein
MLRTGASVRRRANAHSARILLSIVHEAHYVYVAKLSIDARSSMSTLLGPHHRAVGSRTWASASVNYRTDITANTAQALGHSTDVRVVLPCRKELREMIPDRHASAKR